MMNYRKAAMVLLASSGLTMSAGALAQDAAPAEAGAPVSAEEAAAEIEFLKAQLEAIQGQLDEVKKRTATAVPSYKAAPEFKDGDWKFKVRGRFMYDVGYVDNPAASDGATLNGTSAKNMGFNSRIRRARLGVEGAMPGGFSYKAEADFADNTVSWADLMLEYKAKDSPFSVRVGHFETFQSLEQMTSSRHIMFLERAQMNEGFNHGRRLGLGVGYDQGDVLFRAGVFNDTINANYDNDDWLAGARFVYAPKMGSNQLHFGANFQHREYQSNAQNVRYRMRNPARVSDIRLVDTGAFAAKSDNVFGIEAGGVFGPLWVVGEGQYVKAKATAPGTTFTDGDAAGTTLFLANDPSFLSYYVEAGYWLTGESRGYKKGEWDRTKVNNGFDKGGSGAVAVTARYDHLDLSSAKLRLGGTGTNLGRGGTQDTYQLSLVWQPIDYVRITTQYVRAEIEGGPAAATVKPTSTDPINKRSYGVDSFAMRFAFDF